MPKYVGYVTLSQYRSFEFEADDEELAWDHLDTLIDNVGYDRISDEWEESGEPQIHADDIREI